MGNYSDLAGATVGRQSMKISSGVDKDINNRCLLSELHGEHKYTVCTECKAFCVERGGKYIRHYVLRAELQSAVRGSDATR
jgi:hypothetical protein